MYKKEEEGTQVSKKLEDKKIGRIEREKYIEKKKKLKELLEEKRKRRERKKKS